MSQKYKYVILGNGNASKSALDTLCKARKSGEILIISKEQHRTYTPTILPYFILGTIAEKDLFLHPEACAQGPEVHFLLGREVTEVSPGQNRILLDRKEEVFYESLLIATGASPVLPPVEGLDRGTTFTLRTLKDAKAIKAALLDLRDVAVVGAGFIGMHLAEVFARLGVPVKVIEMEKRVLPQSFDEGAALLIQKVFEENGVQFHLSRSILGIEQGLKGSRIILSQGEKIDVDLIVFATGVKPNVDFLRESGLDVDQGIRVDDFMKTNFSNVFAAGDVAQSRDFYTGQKTVNPILPEAVHQGRIAATNMTGGESSFPGSIPRNTFHFFDHFAFSLGMVESASKDLEVHVAEEHEKRRYRKLIVQGKKLIGALGVNETLDPGALFSLLMQGLNVEELKGGFCSPYMDCATWLRWIVERHIGRGNSGENL